MDTNKIKNKSNRVISILSSLFKFFLITKKGWGIIIFFVFLLMLHINWFLSLVCAIFLPFILNAFYMKVSSLIKNLLKPNIERMQKKKNLKGLIKALNNKDKDIRMQSAKALGKIKDPISSNALMIALKDVSSDVRLEAAKALGRIKDEKATEALILMLKDYYKDIRVEALKSLGKMGKRAIKGLAQALRNEDSDTRYNVAKVLDKIQWQPADATEKESYLIAKREWDKLTRMDTSILRFIILTLQHESESVQTDAHNALLRLRTKVVEPLIELLNDKSEDVRKGAAKILGEIGDTRAANPLKSLVNENKIVEWEILWALAQIDKTYMKSLVQLLHNENKSVRLNAVTALSHIEGDLAETDERVVNYLSEMLDEDFEVQELLGEDVAIQRRAISTLCKIRSKNALKPVIHFLKNYNLKIYSEPGNTTIADINYKFLCKELSLEAAVKTFKERADARGRVKLADRIADLCTSKTLDYLAEAMIDESKYWKIHSTVIMEILAKKYSEIVGKKFTKTRRYRNRYGAIESDEGFFAALQDWEESHGPKAPSTDLINAIQKGQLDKVKDLLDKGADINGRTKGGYTLLMTAAQEGHTDIVQYLLEKGADVEAKLKSGQNALITAAAFGHASTVKELLDKGANVNSKFGDGESSLMYAASEGYTEVVQVLLEKGARVNAKRENGWTALMAAAYRGRAKIAKLLLEKGANVNVEDEAGETPLIVALIGSNLLAVPILLDYDADVNATDMKGNPALVLAAEMGARVTDMVQALLDKGANINAKDEYGNTALLSAIKYEHSNMVKILLERGANVNVKNSKGQTPMMIASNLHSSREKNDIINTLNMYSVK